MSRTNAVSLCLRASAYLFFVLSLVGSGREGTRWNREKGCRLIREHAPTIMGESLQRVAASLWGWCYWSEFLLSHKMAQVYHAMGNRELRFFSPLFPTCKGRYWVWYKVPNFCRIVRKYYWIIVILCLFFWSSFFFFSFLKNIILKKIIHISEKWLP